MVWEKEEVKVKKGRRDVGSRRRYKRGWEKEVV